jgi:hypothetical protein
MKLAAAALFASIGCGSVTASPQDAPSSCDPAAAFGTPVPLRLDAMGLVLEVPRLSSDELTIYLAGSTAGSDRSLYAATRASLTDPFGALSPLTAQNTGSAVDPAVSADGLTLWFASFRVANEGEHLYIATRSTTLADFGPPGLVSTVNAADVTVLDGQPFETADTAELWFTSSRAPNLGKFDIWRALRAAAGFSAPIMEAALSSASEDWFPVLSADRLTIYLSSNRAATSSAGGFEIWASHRATVTGGFAAPALVGELNSAGDEYAGWLSPDNCRLYGRRDLGGTTTIFVATRSP